MCADLARAATTNPVNTLVVTPAGNAPVAPAVAASQARATTIATYQFPSDIPKYFFTMGMVDWASISGTIGGTGGTIVTTQSQILLPLPDSLQDTQSVHWSESNLLSDAFSMIKNIGGGGAALLSQAKSKTIQALTGGVVGAVGAGLITGGIAEGSTEYFRLAYGIAPNQFITILFDNPTYKHHEFQWTLAPNNPKEAETIRAIIQLINNSMAPQLGAGLGTHNTGAGLYWNFPQVFILALNPNDDYLFKFKPSVLTNFTVDYSGGHSPAFMRADSATSAGSGPQNAPEAVILRCQFTEIEYWKRGDFMTNAQQTDS